MILPVSASITTKGIIYFYVNHNIFTPGNRWNFQGSLVAAKTVSPDHGLGIGREVREGTAAADIGPSSWVSLTPPDSTDGISKKSAGLTFNQPQTLLWRGERTSFSRISDLSPEDEVQREIELLGLEKANTSCAAKLPERFCEDH